MNPIEIVVIIAIVLFFGYMIGNHIYRKKKNLPTGECQFCGSTKKGNKLVKGYHKKYGKEEHCCSSCCCHKDEEK